MELCHRAQKKLVMAVSFNLTVYNDLGLITIPPVIAFATGLDTLLIKRAKNHLNKLLSKHTANMSLNFQAIVANNPLQDFPDSEGEWVAPAVDLSLLGLPFRKYDSGEEADTEDEEDRSLRAAEDTKRPRAEGSRWSGRMRN